MLMLDLFSGTGGASAPMRKRGWDVVRVDNGLTFTPDTITADVSAWSWKGLPAPDLLWASPPCTEFARESMPWCRTGKQPDLSLLLATIRIISEARPRWWVIENVRGAQPYLGRAPRRYGPVYLWGWFPDFRVDIKPWKEKLSSTDDAGRGRIPFELGDALAEACERAMNSGSLERRDGT